MIVQIANVQLGFLSKQNHHSENLHFVANIDLNIWKTDFHICMQYIVFQSDQSYKELEFKNQQQTVINHNLNTYVTPSTVSKKFLCCKEKVIFVQLLR